MCTSIKKNTALRLPDGRIVFFKKTLEKHIADITKRWIFTYGKKYYNHNEFEFLRETKLENKTAIMVSLSKDFDFNTFKVVLENCVKVN